MPIAKPTSKKSVKRSTKAVAKARTPTPKSNLQSALSEYHKVHGPVAQRTAVAYTPWQQRKRLQRQHKGTYAPTLAAKGRALTVTPAESRKVGKQARQFEKKRSQAFAAALQPNATALGITRAHEDKLTSAIREYEKVHGRFAAPTLTSGAQGKTSSFMVDPQVQRAAYLTQEQRAARNQRIETEKNVIRKKIETGKVDERAGKSELERLSTEQVINSNASLGGAGIGKYLALPGTAAMQIAESMLYTPAFAYQMWKDPIGTIKQIPGAIWQDLTHPLENPGYLTMDILMLKGIAGGVIGKTRAIRGMRNPRDILRTVARPLDTGMTETAPGVYHLNPRNVATITPARLSRPVRAAGKVATKAGLVPGEESALARTARAIEKRNQGRHAENTRGIESELAMDEPRGLQRTAKDLTMVEDIALRSVLNNVDPRNFAALWRNTLEKGRRVRRKGELTDKYLPVEGKAQRRRLNDLIAAAEEVTRRGLAVVDEAGNVQAAGGLEDLAARAIASSERTTARAREVFEETGGRYGISAETAVSATNRIADLVAEHLDVPTRPGRAFISDASERRFSLNPRIFISGKSFPNPLYPFSKARKTGEAVEAGTFDPRSLDVLARRELGTIRYQSRYGAHQRALRDAISPDELHGLYETTKVTERDLRKYWRAVRVGRGPLSKEAKAIIEKALKNEGRISLAELKDLANDVTAEGQIGFFDRRAHGIPEVEVGVSVGEKVLRATVDPLNRIARFLLLATKTLGFVVPNALGVAFMTLMGQGALTLDSVYSTMRGFLHGLSDAQKARLVTLRGWGASRAIIREGDKTLLGRGANRLADFYALFTDDWARTLGVIYEAKNKGYNTPAKFKQLLDAKEGSKAWVDSIEIQMRVDEMYGKFKMSEIEKRTIGRIIFFWPWIRASTIYATTLPIKRPIKTGLLVQGGKIAKQETEDMLGKAVLEFLNTKGSPGSFVVGYRADGRPIVVNPQSAAILQGPFDVVSLLSNPEPFKKLLAMGTPAIEEVGALIGYDTFFGEAYPEGMGLGERLLDTTLGYIPGLTAYERATGKSLVGPDVKEPTYEYSKGQAIAAATLTGGITPRTLNIDTVRKRILSERRKAHPEMLTEATYNKVQWAQQNLKSPESRALVSQWSKGQRAIRFHRETYKRKHGDYPQEGSLEDAIMKYQILKRLRPDFDFHGATIGGMRRRWNETYTGDRGATHHLSDDYKELISDGLGFGGSYGQTFLTDRQVPTELDRLREQAGAG